MNSCFTDMEIEELAEEMIRQYLGNRENAPLKVDIEGFLTGYLKLPLKFRSFAEEDSSKIGFISDGITPLWVIAGRRPIQEVFPKGTIVLDKGLQRRGEEGRRRFTLAHEAGHYIMARIGNAGFLPPGVRQGTRLQPPRTKRTAEFPGSQGR